jgi:hypothetical protein
MIYIVDKFEFGEYHLIKCVYNTEFISAEEATKYYNRHGNGYVVIPNSCVRRIFGSDNWYGIMAFDKNFKVVYM